MKQQQKIWVAGDDLDTAVSLIEAMTLQKVEYTLRWYSHSNQSVGVAHELAYTASADQQLIIELVVNPIEPSQWIL